MFPRTGGGTSEITLYKLLRSLDIALNPINIVSNSSENTGIGTTISTNTSRGNTNKISISKV